MRRCIAVSSTSLFFLLAACADGPTHSGDSESSSTGFPDEEPGAFGSACPEGGLDPDRVYASIFTEEFSASVMLLVDIEQAENGCAYASNSNEELGDSIVRASDGAFVQSVGGVGSNEPPKIVVRRHDPLARSELSGRWAKRPGAYVPGRDEYVDVPAGDDCALTPYDIPALWRWPTEDVAIQCASGMHAVDGRVLRPPEYFGRHVLGTGAPDGSMLARDSSSLNEFYIIGPDASRTEIEFASSQEEERAEHQELVAVRFIDGKFVMAMLGPSMEWQEHRYERWEVTGTSMTSAGFYAFPSAPPADLHAEDEFGQLDAQGRLVMNLHRTETGVELRTVERADLEHHEVLLSGPYFDAPPTIDYQLPQPGLVVRALVTGN